MTAFDFDEPSSGNVVDAHKPALRVLNHGGGAGIRGESLGSVAGVIGECAAGRGVVGHSSRLDGVQGKSDEGTGVFGEGPRNGVHGKSSAGRGVHGENTAGGDGVGGVSNKGTGVVGISQSGTGVYGRSASGLAGSFQGKVEVYGQIAAQSAEFGGNVGVHGTIVCQDVELRNGDCAERFRVATGTIEAGTVIVIGDDGDIEPSRSEYDTRVAGIVAGAGTCRPAITLGATELAGNSVPVSLFGKVFCKVDARVTPIAVGDLLTTSLTVGHAMVATDRRRSFGSVIAKALQPQEGGLGLIAVLVALQ